jgi:hypothetical protein
MYAGWAFFLESNFKDRTTQTALDPLAGGRFVPGCRLGVTLLSRSPSAETIVAPWRLLGIDPSQRYSVRDVWDAADRGMHAGQYASVVPAHGVALLVLTPV